MNSPVLPGWLAPAASNGRASAEQINRTQPEKPAPTRLTTVSESTPRVVFGERRISGGILGGIWESGGYAYFTLYWSHGECGGPQTIYINDATPPGGVTFTHYYGTDSQVVDPTLAGLGVGYNDANVGVCYSVVRVPSTLLPTISKIECIFRGLKLHDPRTGLTTWSRNPSLAMRAAVTSPLLGGRALTGEQEDQFALAADRNDSLVGGVEVRCQLDLVVEVPTREEDLYDLLAVYAEVLWSYDGGGVRVVPDAAVAGPAAVIEIGQIVEGTLDPAGVDLSEAPTVVTVRYTQSSGGAGAWGTASVTRQLPGVTTGEIDAIDSSVDLFGIRRDSEAKRKGEMRLRRLRLTTRWAWQMADEGLRYQCGDVVQLPDSHGFVAPVVRIRTAQLMSIGRYAFTADPYSDSLYPDDYEPGGTTTLPVHAILPLHASAVPSGYAEWTAANDRYLIGAGAGLDVGDTAGSTAILVSGNTATGGAHPAGGGNGSNFFDAANGLNQNPLGLFKGPGKGDHPGHQHSYSKALSLEPLNRRLRFVKKTGAPGPIAAGVGVFSAQQIVSAALMAVTDYAGRMVKASSAAGNAGQSSPIAASLGLSGSAGAHRHNLRYEQKLSGTSQKFYPDYEDAPDHEHGVTANITLRPAVRDLLLYAATDDADVVPGVIIGWDQPTPPPAGWRLCDGTHGTVPMPGLMVRLSSPGSSGGTSGNNTATWVISTTRNGDHDHIGTDVFIPDSSSVSAGTGHDLDDRPQYSLDHDHGGSGSVAYLPPCYAIDFYMYTGA